MNLHSFEEKITGVDFNKCFDGKDILPLIKICSIELDKLENNTVIPSTICFILGDLQHFTTYEFCAAAEKDYRGHSYNCKKSLTYHRLRDLAKEIDICVRFIKDNISLDKVKEIFHHHKQCFQAHKDNPPLMDFSIYFKDDTWMHLEVVSVHSIIQKEYNRFQEKLFNDLNLSENEKDTLFDEFLIEDQDMLLSGKVKKTETTGYSVMTLKFVEHYIEQKNLIIENTSNRVEIINVLNEQYKTNILTLLKLASEEYYKNIRGKSILNIFKDSLEAVVNNPISVQTIGDDGKKSLLRDIEQQIKNKNNKQYTVKEECKQHPQGNVLLIGLRRFNFEDNLKEYIENNLKIDSNFFSEAHIYKDSNRLLVIRLKQSSS